MDELPKLPHPSLLRDYQWLVGAMLWTIVTGAVLTTSIVGTRLARHLLAGLLDLLKAIGESHQETAKAIAELVAHEKIEESKIDTIDENTQETRRLAELWDEVGTKKTGA